MNVDFHSLANQSDLVVLLDLIDTEVKIRWIIEVLLSHGDSTLLPAAVRGDGRDLVRVVIVWHHRHGIRLRVSYDHLSSSSV